MSFFLEAKTATDSKTYSFAPQLPVGDNIRAVSVTASGATVVRFEEVDDAVVFAISGGTAGETAVVNVSVTTEGDDALGYTLYLPIIASTAQIAHTAREYVGFALRRFIGNGEEATSDEMVDGLERLSALVAEWRATGADIGAAFPIETDTVIYCPDWAVSALRYNLLVDCANLYEATVTQSEYMMAMRGKALVKNMNVPDERVAEYF
jgi:hypothetical protein